MLVEEDSKDEEEEEVLVEDVAKLFVTTIEKHGTSQGICRILFPLVNIVNQRLKKLKINIIKNPNIILQKP